MQYVVIVGCNFVFVIVSFFFDNEYWGVYVVVEWKMLVGMIIVILVYWGLNVKFNSILFGFQISQQEKDSQYSIEFWIVFNDDYKIWYMFGVFYYNEMSDVF